MVGKLADTVEASEKGFARLTGAPRGLAVVKRLRMSTNRPVSLLSSNRPRLRRSFRRPIAPVLATHRSTENHIDSGSLKGTKSPLLLRASLPLPKTLAEVHSHENLSRSKQTSSAYLINSSFSNTLIKK